MNKHSSSELFVSVLRLLLVVATVLLLPLPVSADDEEFGSCVNNASHACARASAVTTGKACQGGSTGGCEDCVQSSQFDMCFFGNGPAISGYKTPTASPEG